ncbi:hypothetical protein GH714_038744 [Hevea brasiliensis]|uniref:Uncharacterized protein n=1 Tax=Hevea brasiliensis TaxID=3981 RepID=A0A6A6MPY8_HEVBR|nr:hypothetical protein GH714_038744 [Hevea brasiliensis]
MATNEEGEENTSRGNEWEVVSLTASTYAAAGASGPEVELKYENKDNAHGEDEAETSRALFMSGHFVFPPSQHENLPLDPDNSEILNEQAGENVASEQGAEEGDKSGRKDEENFKLKELNVSEEFPGIQFFDDKEQSIYSTSTFSSLHSETGLSGSAAYGENLVIPVVNEQAKEELDFSTDICHSPKPAKDGKDDGSDLPCEAWWKRRATSLYTHAKETNAFWSIFVAAAVMGLKSGRMLGPISRLKDVIVGGHRRGSLIRGGGILVCGGKYGNLISLENGGAFVKSMEQKEAAEQELLTNGPGTFPLEGLLAIFQSIASVAEGPLDEEHENDVLRVEGWDSGGMPDVLMQSSSLCDAIGIQLRKIWLCR